MSEYAATIKVTEYPPHLKHKTIFQTYKNLESSDSMLIINDHDPIPLHLQFQSIYGEDFLWEYIEQGPDVFQVKITKK